MYIIQSTSVSTLTEKQNQTFAQLFLPLLYLWLHRSTVEYNCLEHIYWFNFILGVGDLNWKLFQVCYPVTPTDFKSKMVKLNLFYFPSKATLSVFVSMYETESMSMTNFITLQASQKWISSISAVLKRQCLLHCWMPPNSCCWGSGIAQSVNG